MGFMKNGEEHRFHLPADGSVYFFNSGIKHWVENNSSEDRIHLIVDTHGQEDLVNLQKVEEM
jgi:aspartyl/asparaginyl beta-hydroxylase (cupin superfamily)